MDAISDERIRTVTVLKPAQIGFSEILCNAFFYHCRHRPCGQLYVMPAEIDAREFSKIRLAPMIRDNPAFSELLNENVSKAGGNSTLMKQGPGFFLTLTGANSPSRLASKPVPVLYLDEVDKFPHSSGDEGDPISLAIERCVTFPYSKVLIGSTPGRAGFSRVWTWFKRGDQRYFHLPCPHCGTLQRLVWDQVKGYKISENVFKPERAYYECEKCLEHLTDQQLLDQQLAPEAGWIAENPAITDHASFSLNQLYSPWVSMAQIAQDWVNKKDQPQELKAWTTHKLGIPWEEDGRKLSPDSLMARREAYRAESPEGVRVIGAAADIQVDRIEVAVYGSNNKSETWHLEHRIFYGDPSDNAVWNDLWEFYLERRYEHESGILQKISFIAVDKGDNTQTVLKQCGPRLGMKVFPVGGQSGFGKPLLGTASVNKQTGVKYWNVYVDSAKEYIDGLLRIDVPGAGYQHFPLECDQEFFNQITAEKLITEGAPGSEKRKWVPTRKRNEQLDMRVYYEAGLVLFNPVWEAFENLITKGRSYMESNSVDATEYERRLDAREAPAPPVPGSGRRVRSRGIQP